jgi:hypothetical protein
MWSDRDVESIIRRSHCAPGLVGSDELNNVQRFENEYDNQAEHGQFDQCP